FTSRHCFRHRPDEKRVIHRFDRLSAEILYFVPLIFKPLANLLLISEPGVIRPDANFHSIDLGNFKLCRETISSTFPSRKPTRALAKWLGYILACKRWF